LLDAVLHLRAGCGIGTCDWAADPELDLRYGGFRERECEAQGETERGDPLHLWLHFNDLPVGRVHSRIMLRQRCLRRQRSGPSGSWIQGYWPAIRAARAAVNPTKARAPQTTLSTR